MFNENTKDILKGLREPIWKWVNPMSLCCGVETKVDGEGETHYWVCPACGKACDVK